MKRLCSVVLALMLALVPLAAGAAQGGDKVTLHYYGWTDEESYMTALIDRFNEENPDIEVVPTFVQHDDHNEKTVVMVSAGSTDLDLISCDSQAFVLNLVSLDGLLPLKSYIDAAGIDLSVFGPIISELAFNDDYYGLPYRSTLYSLYYNKDLFDKKGLAHPEKITWDEYLELARELTYEEEGVKYWGGFLPDWLGAPLSMYQRNSNLLDDDLSALSEWMTIWNAGMNVDKSHMTFAQQTAESVDWLKFFCLGTTGMLINGEWTISMLKDYENQGMEIPNWDVTYLPSFDTSGDIISPGGLSTFIAIGKNTKHVEEAFRFVQFMAGEEASVYLAGQGVLPAYSSESVQNAFAQAAGVPGAATLLDTTIMLEAPSVAGYPEISKAYEEERKLYLTEQQTLEEFDANMLDRREEALDSYR
jgi:multiple sugar transport system substrate-binding protein